jgi:hypothetical protein
MHFGRWLLMACCALALCGALGEQALAQTTAAPRSRGAFEFDPYRVKIWVAAARSPALPASMAAELAHDLAWQTDAIFGAAWQVTGSPCPPSLVQLAATDPSAVQVADITAADAEVLDADKLIIVSVMPYAPGWKLVARELDCRSRTFSDAVERDARQPENLSGAACSAVVAAFAPMVRIETVAGDQAITRLRAGGLIRNESSPALVHPGDVLQPVLRRNDRYGQPRGGTERLAFTFLEVGERDGFRVNCTIQTGVRGAIAGRGSRTEKLALLVRPQLASTRLVLRTRAQPPEELIGYEILTVAKPGSKELTTLGVTDRNGAIELPREGAPVHLIYVRHGQQMLARIPIVPGLTAEQQLSLTDDDPRLLAESYFVAMQNTVLDLIARREVLAARIRLRIKKNELKEAQDMLAELRALSSRADLLREVEQQRSRFGVESSSVQAKVDRMFGELQKLLAKHLDPRLVDDVTAELNTARQS